MKHLAQRSRAHRAFGKLRCHRLEQRRARRRDGDGSFNHEQLSRLKGFSSHPAHSAARTTVASPPVIHCALERHGRHVSAPGSIVDSTASSAAACA